jgi:hypothetical protein
LNIENQRTVVGHDYFKNFEKYVFMEEPTNILDPSANSFVF